MSVHDLYPIGSAERLRVARRLAVRRHEGAVLTDYEAAFVATVVDEVSAENFFMDGELFA